MDALKQYHPAVAFSFFLLMIVIGLASMHPVFQVVGFLTAVCYGIAISGLGPFVRMSWWLLILIAIVTLFNSVFGGQGLTVLLRLDLGFIQSSVTVEGLAYGFCMGLMLASVILWFMILGKVSSMQGFIELFSRFSPTAGMMLARITVFIPELTHQAKLVDKAQRTFALTQGTAHGNQQDQEASAPQTGTSFELVATDVPEQNNKRSFKGQLAYASALSSHLMEWGMEKSLITANSMVARGYGSRKRTSFRRTRLTIRDATTLGIILILGVASIICTVWGGSMYSYYPYLSEITFWWGFVPFILFCLIPLALQLGEELAWWQSR